MGGSLVGWVVGSASGSLPGLTCLTQLAGRSKLRCCDWEDRGRGWHGALIAKGPGNHTAGQELRPREFSIAYGSASIRL